MTKMIKTIIRTMNNDNMIIMLIMIKVMEIAKSMKINMKIIKMMKTVIRTVKQLQ